VRVFTLNDDAALIDYAQSIVNELRANRVSVRLHHGGPPGAKPKAEVAADILAGIKEWRAYPW